MKVLTSLRLQFVKTENKCKYGPTVVRLNMTYFKKNNTFLFKGRATKCKNVVIVRDRLSRKIRLLVRLDICSHTSRRSNI